ncbi:MAG: hypothetical protein AB9856_19045 [Cellulosilyticaceae bacterium]
MFEKFKQSLTQGTKDGKNHKYTAILIGLLIVGLAVTLIPSSPKPQIPQTNQVVPVAKTTKEESYEGTIEAKLAAILQRMEGVGSVDIMVTTDASKEKVLAEELSSTNSSADEKDQGGGTRTTRQEDKKNKVILQQGNVPYVLKENKPQIQGVLVLAEGGEIPEIKNAIIEAISSLLNVPVHKISVFKMGKN